MRLRACARLNSRALDASLAGFFILVDTVLTLAGASWWPAHPGTLAWTMLAVQALADASLVFRRRAPMLVIAILGGYGPFYDRRDRRAAFAAVGTLTLIVCNIWEPSASVITIGVLRTAVGP